MTKRLVIVESPTKAKTLKKFLGDDYLVESSVGHIRDLPASAAEIPADVKDQEWSRLGVNVDDAFQPLYVVAEDKKKVIRELKAKLKLVDELLLATDEDREGEAISWHLAEVLKPKVPTSRMVFHEITKEAIKDALSKTRPIDDNMVEAQEARRIIDRLYGYEVSPILWKKVARGLSAGRVQSVAIRMLVERELERIAFVASHYWDISATFATKKEESFPARLVTYDEQRLATGKDFDPDTGKLKRQGVVLLDEASCTALENGLKTAPFKVISTEEKPFTQSPSPPFTTSTMQQEASRKLKYAARRTMNAAQRLYQLGYITYMRTDSVALSPEAIRGTRKAIATRYGDEYVPDEPRTYKNKVKNAQEAHEAIRPSGEDFPLPEELKGKVSADEMRLYELIWKRTMACQMKNAKGRRMAVRIGAEVEGKQAVFHASGRTIDFHGFLRAYVEGSDDPNAALADREVILPDLAENDPVDAKELNSEDHVTQPPARFTEASLVKALEESGIGRPSTYASIIGTIMDRKYSFTKGTAMVPTFTAFAVVKLMTEHFTELVDFTFTAAMEDRLDTIARGENEALPYLKEFYFGDGKGLRPLLDQKVQDIDARSVCSIPIGVNAAGDPIVVRVGRYGPYLECGEERANLPEDICPDDVSIELSEKLLRQAAEGPKSLGDHPETGLPIYAKNGRFGPYVQLGDATDDGEKPKMTSLLDDMTLDTLTFEQACELLSIPRTLGKDEEGVDVIAYLGRYGPYIKRGEKDTRSLEKTDHILKITLERALELLKQEKRRGRQVKEPLKLFEKVEALDDVELKVLEGRFGAYVTDGEYNASLRRDMTVEELTEEMAVQLILDRRAKGPSKKKKKKKAAKKKAAKKKTAKKAKKKASKKKASKKAAKKKTTKSEAPAETEGDAPAEAQE